MRKPAPVLIFAAALLPAACTVGPNYAPPAIAVENSYTLAGGGEAETAAWWTKLQDKSLDGLVMAAARNNLDLRAAQARIREARSQRIAISGQDGPNLTADGGFQHQRFSQNAAPFNAFNVPGFPWEFNLYQAGFDANWELDVFGGTRRAVEAATATVEAGEEEKRAVLVSLEAEVARNYVELRGYQRQRELAQRNLDLQNQTLTLTRDRVKNGVGSELDVSRATAQVEQTAAGIPLFDRGEWQSLHRLAVLTNQPLEKLAYLRESNPIPVPPDSVVTGVPAELLRRRPDIRRAERQLAAATARIGQAQAELYPKFSLTGYFNLQSASIDDLLNWKSRAFSIGPAVAWPVFEAGRLRALVAVRNAQQEQALTAYEQSLQNAVQEVRDQLVAFTSERTRRDSLSKAVAADRDAADLAGKLYAQGLTDFLTVLDAERQLNEAENALARSDTDIDTSLIALYKALGGGWEGVPDAGSTPPPTPPV
ncbi:MAG TPA: efflux transporter outer membrane subunit, partial [Phycisphaerae bacterium]|nr:efflux transporter outer membrane subunit [Phycisphaerae bacterium]